LALIQGAAGANLTTPSPGAHSDSGIRGALDSDSDLQYWHLDAECGRWMVDDRSYPDSLIVSPVPVATTLPMFMFGLPAGALADIVDRRYA
jgi:hypothetical protein